MVVSVKIKGVNEVLKSLRSKNEKIKEQSQVVLQESGMLLQEEIKESIQGNRAEPRSVDTGEFLASIELSNTPQTSKISSDVPQALFMEFGTSKIDERRHFRNSSERIKPVIVDKFKDMISKIIK